MNTSLASVAFNTLITGGAPLTIWVESKRASNPNNGCNGYRAAAVFGSTLFRALRREKMPSTRQPSGGLRQMVLRLASFM